MSVILDALQRARREGATGMDGSYSATGVPNPGARKKRAFNVTILLLAAMSFLLLAAVAGALIFIFWRLQTSGVTLGTVLKSSTVTQPVAATPVANGPGYVTQGNSLPVQAVDLPVAPIQPMATRPSTQSSSAYAQNALPISRPASADDLPPPVPIAELRSEGAASLPPPPTERSQRTLPSIKLGTVLCESDLCIAIINGRGVREGQNVGGYKVLRITETEVVLQRKGEAQITLTPGQ